MVMSKGIKMLSAICEKGFEVSIAENPLNETLVEHTGAVRRMERIAVLLLKHKLTERGALGR
jgi:hypothetical protein